MADPTAERTALPRCNWLLDSEPEEKPSRCGEPAVARYRTTEPRGGGFYVLFTCEEHDDLLRVAESTKKQPE